jgi:hypothetical protein
MNKLIPLIIIAGSLFVAFKDPVINIDAPIVNVENKKVSENMKSLVSDIKSVIENSKASNQSKKEAAALWNGAGDVWSVLDINTTSDKIKKFNENLYMIYSNKYNLSDGFPGFSDAANKAFSKFIGEYPKQMTKEDCQKMSELCYGIAWAFEQ